MWNRFTFAPESAAAMAAVSRIPGSMELWWVGEHGSIEGAYWSEGPTWQRYELAPAGSAAPDSRIAAVSRIPGSMEVWWVGEHGSIGGAYWSEGSTWQRYELAPAGSASLTGGIAAVSRIPDSIELWWIGADGSVQDAYWYEGSTWQHFTLAPAGSASLTGGIAAVSRIPDSIELWWIGADGSVQDAYWYEGSTWQRHELAPAGSASLTSGIAAVSRIPDSIELWWIGADGSVQDAYWYEGSTWQRHELAPAGSASLTSGIAAVSRIPNTMELWWIGADGSVHDAYWYDGGSWEQFTLAPAGSASVTSQIAVVSREGSSMELWWAGANESIQDAYWYGLPWQQFTLAPGESAAPRGAVAAVSRIPTSMELWWVGADGSVQDAYWYDGGKWEQFTLAPAGSAALDGGLAAVSRIPGSMELWWVGAEGSIEGAFWYEGSTWQRYQLAPVGSAAPNSAIAAVSRIPGSMELWWVGALGSIEGAFWYEGSTWQRYQLAPVGSATAAGGMAAVSRVSTSMELWWVGALGSIEGAFWYDGSPWQRYEIAPAGSATLTGGIAAISRNPDSLELWWVGALGSIEGAYWYDGSPWQRYQLAPAGSATATSAIAAVSRIPTSMELWWVGADGSVQDGFWYDGGTWQQFTLAPPGSASLTGGIAGVSRIPSSMEVWWIGADESVQDANWYEHVVTLDGIEVTQSIQNLANAVPLVSGKPTVVRVYASHAISPGVRVWGTLEVQRSGGKPIKLRARAAVTLDPSRAGQTATLRKDAALSLNFVVPGFLTTPGTLTLALSKLVNEATGAAVGGQYTIPSTVSIADGHPLRVHVVSMRYAQQVNPPPAPSTTFAPTQNDLDHLRSWLRRAYPASEVIWSTSVADSNTAPPFTSDNTNAQLATIRAQDMASGGDHRTHYYGMVADGGFFMRGSAAGIPASADPSVVASGPTGIPTGNFSWDTDGTYGDWYGGHELGHTFGRKHPGFCGETHDDASYPYTNGQLADDDNGHVGFDVGDPALGLPRMALPGTQWREIMTYCPNEWLSDYTYSAIMNRLATEDGLAAGATPGGGGALDPQDERLVAAGAARESGPSPASASNTISVVANVNLTTRDGTLSYVTPVPNVVPTAPVDGSPVVVVFEDASGQPLISYPALVKLNTELGPDEDRTGIVDAVIPVDPAAKSVRLLIEGETVDSLHAAAQPPDLAGMARPALDESSIRLSWETRSRAEQQYRYSVQASTDGGRTWRTLAVGLADPSVDVDRSQFAPGQTVQLRVIATDGFTRSEVRSESFTV